MASIAELSGSVEKQEIFNNNLRRTKDTLEKWGVEWTLVGGLALKAILGEKVEATRKNGTVVDLDGLAIGPNKFQINGALDELRTFSKEPLFPEIGIEPCVLGPKPNGSGRLETLSYLRVNAGNFFLGYKDIEQRIDPRTMANAPQKVNGIELPCLPRKTILFRYLLRGGVLKTKDNEKLVKLENSILDNWNNEPDDSLYKDYLEFAARIRETYPNSVRLYNLYWQLDHLTGDRISGSKGQIYNLIKFFRR